MNRLPQHIKALLNSKKDGTAKDAIIGLHRCMDGATRAIIQTIEIGVQEIGNGRWGKPTAEDEEQLAALRKLVASLKQTMSHTNN